jgi:hypothetical protein
MRLRSVAVPAIFSTTLLLPNQLLAQGGGAAGTVDEGIFVITRNGAVVGRESFRIVRSPSASGDVYRATAQLALGDQRIVPTLSVDANGAPLSYDVAVQDGPEAVRLQGRARPGRFSAMLRTRNGESTKEYVVPPSAVVLDDDIAHQLFFVTLGNRRSGSLTIIDPRSNAQRIATLESRGSAAVEIAGKSVAAMHFAISGPGVSRREFWVDSVGRVLKVAAPERGLVAQRDELPR